MLTYEFLVNGFETRAAFEEAAVKSIFLPLLGELSRRARSESGRLLVFLAAPPAAGKTTLSLLLERLSAQDKGFAPLQALGMDGFHYHQDYILSHTVTRNGAVLPMKTVKGGPESYDIPKLIGKLRDLKDGKELHWPFYDRRLHDVVEEAIPVQSGGIALVEGNWLLLRDTNWLAVSKLCDYGIAIFAREDLLRDRLLERKMRGGATPEEALRHYESNDGPNVRRFLADSGRGDLTLRMTGDGAFERL